MRILYLDDSGKVHPNDPARVVLFAGFSVHESRWHAVARQITGAKANFFRNRNDPHAWEIKSNDFLSQSAWQRRKNRQLCFEIARILRANKCHVYATSLDKTKATAPLAEATFVPLMFQRTLAKFNDEVDSVNETGMIVCDWSTHQMDQHITHCIASMVGSKRMERMIGGVSYASSIATPCVQVCDLIAGTIRRNLEGTTRLDELADRFRQLHYTNATRVDVLDYHIDSIQRIF